MDRTEAYEQVKAALEACPFCHREMDFDGTFFSHPQAECAMEHSLFHKDSEMAVLWNNRVAHNSPAQQPAQGTEVERVARALAAEDYRQKQRGDYNDADTFASRHWGKYQPKARVAIAALSHPVPTLEYEVIGYTGSGSVSSLAYGGEGHIWAKPGDAHPLPVYGPKGMLSEKRQT